MDRSVSRMRETESHTDSTRLHKLWKTVQYTHTIIYITDLLRTNIWVLFFSGNTYEALEYLRSTNTYEKGTIENQVHLLRW